MGANVSKNDTHNVKKGKGNATRDLQNQQQKSTDSMPIIAEKQNKVSDVCKGGPKHLEKQTKDLDLRQTKSNDAMEIKDERKHASKKKASNWFVPLSYWQTQDLATLMGEDELRDDPYTWSNYCDRLVTRAEPEVVPETERKTWKTIRLFVSSTFKDMGNERDYLVKKVFPQLREWCEGRKLRLVECDLRWGVPIGSNNRETFMACLSEIDRCREENIHPYFLTLMSERYGWAPEMYKIPDDIRARYKWMPGMSVTTSEIMVGGYWDKNKNALFMFRSPDYLVSIRDKTNFVESKENSKTSLRTLKSKIKAQFPNQTYTYSCKYEDEDNGIVKLCGFEEMGERVLTHFKAMMDHQYPTNSLYLEPSLAESLRNEHETFMFQRSRVLLGRDREVAEVMHYIDTNVKSQVPYVLFGYPGSGKSALVASSIKQCLQNRKYRVFYHFIGATPGSTDLFSILQRLFLEFMPDGTMMPTDLTEMKRYAKNIFEYAAKRSVKEGYKKIVVFIDALNQMDDDGDCHFLVWLPRQLPEGMRLVVSTLEGRCLESLRGLNQGTKGSKAVVKAQDTLVNPLYQNIRAEIVTNVLMDFNKKLDAEQLESLITKDDAGRPLWLTVACEELRVFGDYKLLLQKIKDLPQDIAGLLEVVLRRIVKEYGGDLVQATLCLIEMSRFGLLETELLDLLARQPTCPGADRDSSLSFEGRLPMAKWALVYVGLRQFLRPCGGSGEGRLDFHHRTISKVVRKLYLMGNIEQIWWHKRLIEYFETCSDIERKAEELPYHLECSGNKEKLKQALLEQDMFDQMYKDNNKQQLMKYWRFIGGYELAATCYIKSLKKYISNMPSDVSQSAPIQTKVASFLCDIGEYEVAKQLMESVIRDLQTHGHDDSQLIEPLHLMINLIYKKILTYVYGGHQDARAIRQVGVKYSSYLIQICEKHLKDNKRLFGRILMICGYFEGVALQNRAKVFLEEVNDQQGLAQLYYMLGSKHSKDDDINVPLNLYKMSMTLCLSMFGRYSLHTARCAQLHGQCLWNRYAANAHQRHFLEDCLDPYLEEIDILSEVQGTHHPNTVRSREDVIIILNRLGRHDQEAVFRAQQPIQHNAL